MKRDLLTAERAREKLDYDPETGVFTWRTHYFSHLVGQRAGGRAREEGGRMRVTMCIDGARHEAGRVAWLMMTGERPNGRVAFLNGDNTDLRWANLVVRTHSESMVGRSWSKVSPYRGVNLQAGRWLAQIGKDRKTLHIGSFGTPEEAARAYDARARALYGDAARLNFPDDQAPKKSA